MRTTHTPGPWRLDRARVNVTDSSPDRYVVATCHAPSLGELAANARLISAAPDMLNTLKTIMAHWEENGEKGQTIGVFAQSIRNAINKAEGGAE